MLESSLKLVVLNLITFVKHSFGKLMYTYMNQRQPANEAFSFISYIQYIA